MDQFKPHPKNPNILVGNRYKLKNPPYYYSWKDSRTEEEILEDVKREQELEAKNEEKKKIQEQVSRSRFLESLEPATI